MNKDSAQQIEMENTLRSIDGISTGAIDEIMNLFLNKEKVSLQPISKDETEDELRLKLLYEKDWRKKAALSAMIISKTLE
jgi:hypothetical protein